MGCNCKKTKKIVESSYPDDYVQLYDDQKKQYLLIDKEKVKVVDRCLSPFKGVELRSGVPIAR